MARIPAGGVMCCECGELVNSTTPHLMSCSHYKHRTCPDCGVRPGEKHLSWCITGTREEFKKESERASIARAVNALDDEHATVYCGPLREKRTFETGATRDTEDGKPDYEGYLSPLVIEAYGRYLQFHSLQKDGTHRASDNWQKGIPRDAYMKSGWRHFFDWWRDHRGLPSREGLIFALCGLLFNAMGYLHEYLKANPGALERDFAEHEEERLRRKIGLI